MKKIDKAIVALLDLRGEIIDLNVSEIEKHLNLDDIPKDKEFTDVMKFILENSETKDDLNIGLSILTKGLIYARIVSDE